MGSRRRNRAVAVLGIVAILMALAFPPTLAAPRESRAGAGAIDYLHAAFQTRRVLDWGDRPNWSRDGRRLAFSESDTEDGFAYELDLDTGDVRCLTCRWGPGGLVTRIYHLPDNSYLIEAAPGRETSSPSPGGGLAGLLTTELYWMPASAALPPQPLDVPASGEVAISSRTASGGGFLIAWSSPFTLGQMMTGELFHDGSRAAVTNRRTIPTQLPDADGPLGGYGEPYDFARNDEALVFWGFAAPPLDGEMFEVDLATGAVQRLYRDPSHNETHLFPDERFGLKESNRASDPDGPIRGVSGLVAGAPGGGRFDLFVVALDGPMRIRRLTDVSDVGGQANQSVPAPDGASIAFVLDAPPSGAYAGKGGLYVGEFLIDGCAKDGQRRLVPRPCRP